MVYYTGKPIEKGIRNTSHKQNGLLAGKQFTFHDDAKSHEKDNNCVNFWCRKSLGKLNRVPTSNKTDSFSILDLFYVKIKFLNERNCSKRDI